MPIGFAREPGRGGGRMVSNGARTARKVAVVGRDATKVGRGAGWRGERLPNASQARLLVLQARAIAIFMSVDTAWSAVGSDGFMFVSGQVGSRPDGSPEPDLKSQVRLAFDDLNAVLAADDCTFEDVVDVTVFIVDPEKTFDVIWAVVQA